MTKKIDLKPGEWRVKGWQKPKRRMSDRALRWLTVASGIWAATCLLFLPGFTPEWHGLLRIAVMAGPGFLLFLYAAFTD